MSELPVRRFYDGADYRINDSIGYLMRQVVGLVSTITDDRMADHGLTDAQWKPLLMIGRGHCNTAAELSRQVCSDAGAVTRMIDRVEAKGFIRRCRSQEDRRVVNLELTEEGSRAAEIVPHVLADVLNQLLAGFEQSEVDQLRGFLVRLLDNARQVRESDLAAKAEGAKK